jgi:hypothetical protein
VRRGWQTAIVTIARPAHPPDDAPDDLAALWPLVLHWAESDDLRRASLVETATDDSLRALVEEVRPSMESINAYLDRTGDAARAVPFGDLAQAVLEAELLLGRRPQQPR